MSMCKATKKKKIETFLINVTVLEGRHYAWENMNSYVHIKVHNKQAVTKTRYATDAPFYNEYFVFEYKTTLNQLLDQHVTLTVFRSRSCCKLKKILGYITLDVETIWEEEDHQFFRKWAILNSSKADFSGPMGYLKVTLSVLTQGAVPKIPMVNPLSDNEIEGNLLLPEGITERKKALYIFKFYRGYDIIKKKRGTAVIEEDVPETEMNGSDLPNVSIRVTFAGLTGCTSIKKRTSYPIWNESVTLSELYPPLSQRIRIDMLYQHKGSKYRETRRYVHLHSICSYKKNGFLPTFGPAFLHFSKICAMGEEYVGKLLMAMETKVFADVQTKTRCTFKDGVPPVYDSNLWDLDNIFLFASIANVSVIDKRYSKDSISFELNWGRMKILKNENGDNMIPHVLTPKYQPKTSNRQFWYLDFQEIIPCMHIVNNYPTMKGRMFRKNHLDRIVTSLGEKLTSIRELFKSEIFVTYSHLIEDQLQEYFDYLGAACTKFVDMIKGKDTLYQTDLDIQKEKQVQEELLELVKLSKNGYNPRMKKKSFRRAEGFYLRIVKLLDYPQECWPNICLWMKSANRKTECLRFEPRELIHSEIFEEKGKYSGQLNNFYFMTNKFSKSLSPVVCKIELFVWLGMERDKGECFKLIPNGFKIPVEDKELTEDQNWVESTSDIPKYLKLDDYVIFNGRVHIYQGRFALAFDYTGLSDFFARVIIHDQSKQTRAPKQTLNPIWDETLIFKNIVCYGTKEHITNQPPPIVLEVNDQDRWSLEYVGFCLITPTIKFKDETYSPPKFPPKLEWHKVKVDDVDVGEVLACVEFLEATDDVAENEKFITDKLTISIPDDIRPILINYRFEVMFWGVRHLKKLKHAPIKSPKIFIECNEYKIETEIADIGQLNFTKTLYILDMQLPNITSFIPPIMIKLYECKSFNRCKYAGTHLSFIQEFLYKPISLKEFQAKLKQPVSRSLDTLPSKTESEMEEHLENLRKAKKRQERKKYILWRIRLICNCSNFRGLGMSCLKSSWKGFKKGLRFVCCLLLCCGCGRMFKKKKRNLDKQDGAMSKFIRAKETVIDINDNFEVDEVKDWWSKYFNSLGDPYSQADNLFDKNFKITIYDNELENQQQFANFEDAFTEYRIYRGKTTGDLHEDEKAQIGTVKCKIATYEWLNDNNQKETYVTPQGTFLKDGYFHNFPSNHETLFLVRIYCVRAIKLRPTDSTGSTDSYIGIKMNKQVIDDQKNYVPNSTNPFYGRCYEFEGSFPKDNTITIAIFDWDKHSHTDLIGQTKIDIENRFYSRHRAKCGLPLEYVLYGETPWRDMKDPTEILNDLCERNNLPLPEYQDNNTVTIANKKFVMPRNKERENEPDFVKKEMFALYALQKWNEFPVIGYHLVPEHVETRSLYHPETPGIEQGKLQMWIDIFPILDTPIPYPVNIRTRAPVTYELRVIIWNTDKVVLNEDDFFGDRKSDIYVKGWITNPGEAQETDVHYRSMTGEGNFNWRFVFVFDYLSAENMIVEKKKQLVHSRETEIKLPCRLTLQVWDNDIFSKDDFLGSLTLYLNRMPRGAKQARQCTVKNFEGAPRFNLFKVKRAKGWWPFLSKQRGNHMKSNIAGKLEAEFELITADQTGIASVGLGRNAPQPLAPPKRPSTSFNWIFNPWKTCRFIVWRGLKWKLVICLIVVLFALFMGLFLYSLPGYSVKKLLHV